MPKNIEEVLQSHSFRYMFYIEETSKKEKLSKIIVYYNFTMNESWSKKRRKQQNRNSHNLHLVRCLCPMFVCEGLLLLLLLF